ncbi:MAG TPA: hypothetical protein EYQ50_16505 [Verrucomicrobiales bacterium]|nr:hypothetical protein [Verrucomicrobiales bacterium]
MNDSAIVDDIQDTETWKREVGVVGEDKGSEDNEEMPHDCPDFYFMEKPASFFVRSDFTKDWIMLNEGGVKRYLKGKNHSAKVEEDGEPLSEIDQIIHHVQMTRYVRYAGGLAGHPVGFTHMSNEPILVTKEAKLLDIAPGEFPVLQQLLNNLFDRNGGDELQYKHFLGWLQGALSGLYGGRKKFRQALALVGPPESGKSLLQKLITVMTGGRAAKPFQFMTGATSFNSDLFAAEHLMIEDEFAGGDYKTRKFLAANIKQVAANEDQYCHMKNLTVWTLRPYWILTLTLNEDQDALGVLPNLDGSIDDKLMILRVNKKPTPMPTVTADDQKKFWNTLISELPHFVHYLLNEHEIDKEILSDRFTVKHYHHPWVTDQLTPVMPETRLLELLDMVLFSESSDSWVGSTTELFDSIISRGKRDSLFTVCRGVVPLGKLMKRLELKQRDRVFSTNCHNKSKWTITAPNV